MAKKFRDVELLRLQLRMETQYAFGAILIGFVAFAVGAIVWAVPLVAPTGSQYFVGVVSIIIALGMSVYMVLRARNKSWKAIEEALNEIEKLPTSEADNLEAIRAVLGEYFKPKQDT